jgi:flagellar assembly protein FliH
VERELLTLAMALARQIVRRELKADPTQIIGIIREAIAALPVAAREVRVHLHPEDAAVVREHLAPTESERAWAIVEDPVMARGGCQITTGHLAHRCAPGNPARRHLERTAGHERQAGGGARVPAS